MIEGNINRAKYREILDENLLQSAQDLRLGQKFTFQQDYVAKYTVKTTQVWLRVKSLNVLEWCWSISSKDDQVYIIIKLIYIYIGSRKETQTLFKY